MSAITVVEYYAEWINCSINYLISSKSTPKESKDLALSLIYEVLYESLIDSYVTEKTENNPYYYSKALNSTFKMHERHIYKNLNNTPVVFSQKKSLFDDYKTIFEIIDEYVSYIKK